MSTKNIFSNVYQIFSDFLSTSIPKSVSNVLWSIYNGLQGAISHIEYKVDTFIRENNILTATHTSSLRSLAAMNGYEPTLPIPSQGLLRLNISNTVYNTYGYPLYIPPYCEFKCKDNNLTYYYSQDKPLRLTGNVYDIPVIEGSVKSLDVISDGSPIFRTYITTSDIANDSISVIVDNKIFPLVKSFVDSPLTQCFEYKFSHDIQRPIVLYIKGTTPQSKVHITYRTCMGTIGNLTGTSEFSTQDIIDQRGEQINPSSTDLKITNIWGFQLSSDGTSKDELRAATGYNHGQTFLFDNKSYQNFLSRYSTLMLQSITNPEDKLSHNIIRLFRKQLSDIQVGIVSSYQSCVRKELYLLTKEQREQLQSLLKEEEYCLTSSELRDPVIVKYALQIKYPSLNDKQRYQSDIDDLIYENFAKLLYTRHSFSLQNLLDSFKNDNDIDLEYYIFCDHPITDSTITNTTGTLPLLQGDFYINDTDRLFADINHVI